MLFRSGVAVKLVVKVHAENTVMVLLVLNSSRLELNACINLTLVLNLMCVHTKSSRLLDVCGSIACILAALIVEGVTVSVSVDMSDDTG